MNQFPIMETERLILRQFSSDDAGDVRRMAGETEIAAFTLLIPHPYEDGVAEQWISTHQEKFDKGEQVIFAIVLRSDLRLVGTISLTGISKEHSHAELGYWIGKEFWGQGFCTEAGRAVLRYGFDELGLNRIHSSHFARNPASGRVMRKIGMIHEGTRRLHIRKWGVFEDDIIYGILKTDWKMLIK